MIVKDNGLATHLHIGKTRIGNACSLRGSLSSPESSSWLAIPNRGISQESLEGPRETRRESLRKAYKILKFCCAVH
jgi:hypothetical protein